MYKLFQAILAGTGPCVVTKTRTVEENARAIAPLRDIEGQLVLADDSDDDEELEFGSEEHLVLIQAFADWMANVGPAAQTATKYVQHMKQYFKFCKAKKPLWVSTHLIKPHLIETVPCLPPIGALQKDPEFPAASLHGIINAYLKFCEFLKAHLHNTYFGNDTLPDARYTGFESEIRAKQEEARRLMKFNSQEVGLSVTNNTQY